MKSYSRSKMDTVFYDHSYADVNSDCEVRIGNNNIVISYKDAQGTARYIGKEIGRGHYLLECPARNGRATLHMFPDGKILDGYWSEEGYEGFWRIYLY
jgi:hypothetical protein